MTEDDLKKLVLNRYRDVYPSWTDLRVTAFVPDVFGRNLAVVKAREGNGGITEGEICFVAEDGKVTTFQTTEDLAAALRPELPPGRKTMEEAKTEIRIVQCGIQEEARQELWRKRGLVICGILLAISVTAAGFLSSGTAAGVLGLFVTLFMALQNAFNFNEKAEFQRVLFTESDNLLNLLKFRVRTQSQFDAVIDAFMTLNKRAATNLPHGRGMDVVREMYGKTPEGL
jgi:hypothetical protein